MKFFLNLFKTFVAFVLVENYNGTVILLIVKYKDFKELKTFSMYNLCI